MTLTTMVTRTKTGRRPWLGRLARSTCTLVLLCSLPAAMAPVQRSLAAGTATTVLTLTQSSTSSVAGQPVVFRVTALCSNGTCPDGKVNFFEQLYPGWKPTLLGSVQLSLVSTTVDAAFSTTALGISYTGVTNPHSVITAEYPGDSTFHSSYTQVNHTVTTGTVAVSVTSDFSQIPINVPFQLHATVTPQTPSTRSPTGSVTFTAIDPSGVSHDWGSAPVDANGQASLPICININLGGTYTVTVSYGGDALYAKASASSITVVAT